MRLALRFTLLFIVAFASACLAHASEPGLTSQKPLAGGRLLRYDAFPSNQVDPRTVDVWLPRDYDQSKNRYDVLYIQDGQNLFLPAESFGGVTWGIAEHLQHLIDSNRVRPAIIVGIWNTPKRGREYATSAGQNAPGVDLLAQQWKGASIADPYVRFLTRELKPFVDSHYRTLPDAGHTFLMGSSLGGVISLYAFMLHPEMFAGAACLSPHWILGSPADLSPEALSSLDGVGNAFLAYIDGELPAPGTHKLYFDYGDQTLDAYYAPYRARMDSILAKHGYLNGKNAESLFFPGASHTESSWRARIDKPLLFLLSKQEQ